MKSSIFILIIVSLTLMVFNGCSVGTISNFTNKEINSNNNLIINSSFELNEDESENPDNWLIMQGIDTCNWTTEDQNSGVSCLKIEKSDVKTKIISESFPVDPAGVYFSRCFVRSEINTEEPIELILVTFDSNGNKLNVYREEMIPDADWNELKLTSGYFHQNSKNARLTIVVPESLNKICIDDVESYKVHRFAFSRK